MEAKRRELEESLLNLTREAETLVASASPREER